MSYTAHTAYHEDSDADDEYERSMTSPHVLPSDSEASPTDSDPPSTEHTPRLYGHFGDDRSPTTLIVDWSADETAEYISSLGLPQYYDAILDNEIVGEALIALGHEELKEMGVHIMGHRLTILKSVYDIKIRQGIRIEPEHYIPPSVAASKEDSLATQDDVARIVQSIKLRDERIIETERELRKITEEYRKLREELLPVFRMAKDKSQPLPFHPGGGDSQLYEQDRKSPRDVTTIEPSPAAAMVQTHLAASMANGSSANSPSANQQGIPSPTSPPHTNYQTTTLNSSSRYRDQPSSGTRAGFPESVQSNHPSYLSDAPTLVNEHRSIPASSNNQRNDSIATTAAGSVDRGGGGGGGGGRNEGSGGGAPTVDIFKSFRVSMDDPCYKVLPAALKKYNINADWKQYALYIVYGDQERCLGLQEKPLILFKQLDKEGLKPMFMLRRHAAPAEGHAGPHQPDAGQSVVPQPQGRNQGGSYQAGGIQLPGGVL